MKYNIFVLSGGKSIEHEISLKSASAIINAIDRDKYDIYPVFINHNGVWNVLDKCDEKIEKPEDLAIESNDTVASSMANFLEKVNSVKNPIVFPALHGQNGEDGTIQGFLEMLNIPYIGCGVLSSSIAMDKVVARDLFSHHGLPQTKYTWCTKSEWLDNPKEIIDRIENKITYPMYVKPANAGSSVGISKVDTSEDLPAAIDTASNYDTKIIIEKEVIGREMNVAVIGNEKPLASVVGEFIQERPFLDYSAKYIEGKIVQVVPAKLDEETTEKVRDLSIDVYNVLNCTGLARVDIFVDDDNHIYINEANTMPGFTDLSMTPVLWAETDGTTYTELVERLIQFGLDRYNKRQEIVNKR